MNKKKNIITFAAFLILMVGLGANDAMRGIFPLSSLPTSS